VRDRDSAVEDILDSNNAMNSFLDSRANVPRDDRLRTLCWVRKRDRGEYMS